MNIRPAIRADLKAILEINLRAIFETCVSQYALSDLKQWVGDRSENNFEKILESTRLYVAEQNGRSVGFLNVIPGEILAVYVHPDHQGRGYGKKLLLKGIQEAKQDSHEVVVFASLNAVAFYEKFGFERQEEVKDSRHGIDLPMVKMRVSQLESNPQWPLIDEGSVAALANAGAANLAVRLEL
jgi:ribosomal protein S18 acetylase RimI-like enzyme